MPTPRHLSDRYELSEIIGFGGMSEVHLARDLRLQRDVAIKVLRTELARNPRFYLRFRREAQHVAGLNHPAIVAVHDTGEVDTPDGRVPYIVMEFVDGVTLREVMNADGPVAPQRAVEIIADACAALHYSHQKRIIHRDVKPANIMLTTSGAVKVMDFGIARALHDDGEKLTQTSAVIGTAHYLSPEQANGDPVDARSDIYSLGCVLYEILTGVTPFVGDSPVAVAYQHVRNDPAAPSTRHPGISPELDAVVLKALAKNPDNRYQSAAEMRNDLIRVHAGEEPDAPRVFTDADRTDLLTSSPARRDTGFRISRRWIIAAALLTVFAIAVTVLVNVAIGNRQRIPDVSGQSPIDAKVQLQNLGFKTLTNPASSATVRQGTVIGTDPAANTNARLDDTVTINVSSGPEQRPIPDVANLSPSDAADRLKAAGFVAVDRTDAASATVPKGVAIRTNPPAGTTSAVTDKVTIEVSAGPDTQRLPDVAGQTVDLATTNLTIAGYTTILKAPVDGPLPEGQVVATDPPGGTEVSVDSAVTLKVSKGNQIPMPDLTGYTWDDLLPYLHQTAGLTGPIQRGPDVQAGDQGHFKVVQQSPAPQTPITRDGTITVNFGS
jgi:serine/threonine-protein kinase